VLASDARILAVATALVGLVDALAAGRGTGGADELVALTDSGLDARTRRRLERDGRLPVVRLGRKKFTTRAALAALVNAPTTAAAVVPTATDATTAARAAYAPGPLRMVRGAR
jgi:hypothetical protein